MIIIIGAGLSGLATAYRLHQAGLPFSILEANSVAGGRVQPVAVNGSIENSGCQDLGPSWVWPYAQPIVEEWLELLGIKTFEQYDTGDALIDLAHDQQAQTQVLPGQHGIARIEGGTHAMVRALLDSLPDVIRYNEVAKSCHFEANKLTLNVENTGAISQVVADAVVVATPPRLAAALLSESVDVDVDNSEYSELKSVLQQTPTWMAQHAKVVMLYDSAFWRERGLSGRIASQVGPLAEIHDHSGPSGKPAALFGFVGFNAKARAKAGDALIDEIQQQLKRCFGADAPRPTEIILKDWAVEKYTSTEADLAGPGAHPSVIDGLARRSWCNNRLWFAASETSKFSPGLIEGALARANDVAEEVVEVFKGNRQG